MDWLEAVWREFLGFFKILLITGSIGLLCCLVIFLMFQKKIVDVDLKPDVTKIGNSVVYRDTIYDVCFIKAKLDTQSYMSIVPCEKIIPKSSVVISSSLRISSLQHLSSSSLVKKKG
jgi:hypothetical protein